jgi:hypothetical protein
VSRLVAAQQLGDSDMTGVNARLRGEALASPRYYLQNPARQAR